eukprot:gene16945-20158_t
MKIIVFIIVATTLLLAAIVGPVLSIVQIGVSKIDAAQTHVMPGMGGLKWTMPAKNVTLHLIGNRQALFLIDFTSVPTTPTLQAYNQYAQLVYQVAMTPPANLPVTESNGAKYSTTTWSAVLPAQWVQVGLAISFSDPAYYTSLRYPMLVGMTNDLTISTLPFYLFGCNPSKLDCGTLAQTSTPPAVAITELAQKWPVSTLSVANHPAGYVQLPYLIVPPGGPGFPAIRIAAKEQSRDSYSTLTTVLGLVSGIRSANGDALLNSHHYGPVIMSNAAGNFVTTGGGYGNVGGSTSIGDEEYGALYIHEQGHAFGLWHSQDGYPNDYPYPQGSLYGSKWGFDFNHNEFLSTLLPTQSPFYTSCASSFVLDNQGRCVKKSVMGAGGAGGSESTGYRYSMFADYEAGIMQQYFEGKTTLSPTGDHQFNGGRFIYDSSFPSGYKRWDTISSKFVGAVVTNESNGLYGMDAGLPYIRNVPVATVMITYSSASTASVSQIYPLVKYTGNLRRWIDPTSPAQCAIITPNTGQLPWYCHASGCDYTLRVTYADQSKVHVLIQQGIRSWFNPSGSAANEYFDQYNGASFHTIIQNVPADKTITLVELLLSNQGYNGLQYNAYVLLSRAF